MPEEENLIGAIDIVAAFTALRQDVKTQIRSGRELQDTVASRLGELDVRLQSMLQQLQQAAQQQPTQQHSAQPAKSANAKDENAATRQLAEALAEVEEALQRALTSIPDTTASPSPCSALLSSFDAQLATVPWWARGTVAKKLNSFRTELTKSAQWQPPDASAARQGLTLILARVHRIMNQTGLERMDVAGRAFDAELMFAIDTVECVHTPRAHVAEQVRPAYLWQGKLLRNAEVRLAK